MTEFVSATYIESQLNGLYYEMEILEENFKKDQTKIEKRIWELRKLCTHADKRWVPDASGNNDSCEVCQICGKEAKRL